MVLIDSSALVEFLRDTGSAGCDEVDRLLDSESAITEPVVMEILAGARDETQLGHLRGLLGRSHLLPSNSADFEAAALLFRSCRRQGETVRNLIDCLIAAVAIRTGLPVLHHDADFDVLERHTPLQVHRPQA